MRGETALHYAGRASYDRCLVSRDDVRCGRCKYFKFGEGTCPFSVGGTLQGSGGCMFAHTGRDGLPIEGNRLYMGEDGELQRVRTYDLCDFIAPKKTQGSRKKKK